MKRTRALLGLLLGATALVGCGGGGETPPMSCQAASAEGLAVSATDPHGGQPYALGYPPYAIDGCSLAYVSSSGELRLRDLAAGGESLLAAASEKPRRPAIAGDLLAWEATLDGTDVVRVRGKDGVKTIAGSFDHAGEPRVAADAVIFTGWLAGGDEADTDVFLYTPSTGALVAVATGPGQQRFADVSATHAAWTDFAEDADGTFDDDGNDVADLGVLDRRTQATTVRQRSGKQAFPLLGALGKIAYLDWNLVHPEPKFSGYDLRLGDLAEDVANDLDVGHIVTLVPYVRPAARGAQLEWVATPNGGNTELLRRDVDLAAPAETVNIFEGVTVFGPSASDAITLVGARASGAVTLRAFTR